MQGVRSDSHRIGSKPVELSGLGQEGFKKLLDSVDNFIFDCDGVLWLSDRVLPAAPKLIPLLRKLGKHVYFITNNSLTSLQQILDKFKKAGIDVGQDNIVFPTILLCHHLEKINFKGKIEVLGEPAQKTEIRARGFDVNDDEVASKKMQTEREFRKVSDVTEKISAVMLDLDLNCSYIKVSRIIDILQNQNCLYFAGCVDRKVPITEKLVTAGPEFLIDMIKELTGREPEVLGKPSPKMFELLKERFSIDQDRSIFVGDSIGSDIKMSNTCGIRSILVLTGSTRRENIPYDDPLRSPNYVSESITEILSLVEKL